MTDVENLRYEAGKEARIKGESLHDGASEEFARGFYRGNTFGSNVTPRSFGKGGFKPEGWVCVCGFDNKAWMKMKKNRELVCWKCGTPKEYGEDKEYERT